jgi:acyl-CoA synthetase (AMP-forming)/AMP-acid ligase II
VSESSGVNVAHLLRHAATCFPDRPAISWRGTTIDYRTFDARAAAFAEWLRSVGAAPGERVVLYLDNRPDLLVAMFGTFGAGSAVLPSNARLTQDELGFLIDDGEAKVVVTDGAHVAVAKAAAASVPHPPTVVVCGDELDGLLDYLLDREISPPEVADVSATDTAWIFYTSGTTGRPKGAMLSNACLGFCTVSWLADLTPLDEHDVTLHAAPLTHGAGFHALAAVARGAHQVIADSVSFDAAAVLDAIRRHGVTNTWLVPTQIVLLTDAAERAGIAGEDLTSLQYVVYGGAPITQAAITRALERFGPVFVQLFGQGETPMTATVLRRDQHVPDLLASVGRARPGIEIRIVASPAGDGSSASHDALPTGEVGELVVRGPSLMTGYWKRPDATAETIRDGWLHTGDLGRMTADGVVHLLDRAKDMIISGGSNVYAVEVEDVLARHDSVAEVAVVGLPDDVWGEVVVAAVVTAGGGALDTASLDQLARSQLAGYKIPRRYVSVERLPRNAYGKVLKRELRQQLAH